MIDLTKIENYRENNRIEAKKALGGLPQSIWETYSAFANTLGGVILLGVEEYKDKSLHPVDLPDPERLVREFWRIINDRTKVSGNILHKKRVEIVQSEGKKIIVIVVPRAPRTEKPVYIGNDPFTGTYRRNGEGDYKCSKEQVRSMLRDAEKRSLDMESVKWSSLEKLKRDSIKDYRRLIEENETDTSFKTMSDIEFLCEIGAAVCENGKVYPTGAGLLVFGKREEISHFYPRFRLCFEERITARGVKRYCSEKEGQIENLFDFYVFAIERLNKSVENRLRKASERQCLEIKKGVSEALVNCLVNADYHGKKGIVITQTRFTFVFCNAGSFRADLEIAKNGGVSDPRNSAVKKIFYYLGMGSGTGNGILDIFAKWRKIGWALPTIKEEFNSERVTFTLPFRRRALEKSSLRSREGKENFEEMERCEIIEFLTERISATLGEIAAALHFDFEKACLRVEELEKAEILVQQKGKYRLKG